MMEPHEKRNELPAIDERTIELLIYGTFEEFEGDKGFYSMCWMSLEDVLMDVDRAVVSAKLTSYKEELTSALGAKARAHD